MRNYTISNSIHLTQLFTGYGLTKNQAIVLATLTQTNCCISAKQISQISNIARESIYGILLNLREKGLIQKSILKPEKYCAIPLKRTILMLHEEKNQEIHTLEELTTQVLFENSQKSEPKHNNNNTTQFVLIPKKKQLITKINQSISKSKKNVKISTSWKRYLQGINVYEKALKTAISKGIKLQIFVAMKPPQENIPEKSIFFHDSPNVSIKFNDIPVKIVLAIIDDMEVFLMTNPKLSLAESPALWSNNQSLLSALTSFFETSWKNS